MQEYKNAFLALALEVGALKFGKFELKSGRISPYFFNAGLFSSGKAMALLAKYYANAIVESGVEFDVLFGPAYKGIPLAATVATALYDEHGINKPYCYNRKEAKNHGEGGQLVGAELSGRVLLIDDVISAGTAIQESAKLIDAVGGDFAAAIISLDRQEKGQGERSAVQEVEAILNINVVSIASLDDLLNYLQDQGLNEHADQVASYRKEYGADYEI